MKTIRILDVDVDGPLSFCDPLTGGGGLSWLPFGGGSIVGTAAIGGSVIAGAVQGSPPSPFGIFSSLTATATGPTPGGVGGRYPASQLGATPSFNNVGGGQLGQSLARGLVGQ